MAAKKIDMDAISIEKEETGINTGEVYAGIERGKDNFQRQSTASPEEARERANELRTQGRKGCKAPRITLAFTPDNYEYTAIVSKVMGKTMTGFVNYMISEYRINHPDIYDQAKAVIDAANKGKDEWETK